jgi:hypothetical protein
VSSGRARRSTARSALAYGRWNRLVKTKNVQNGDVLGTPDNFVERVFTLKRDA